MSHGRYNPAMAAAEDAAAKLYTPCIEWQHYPSSSGKAPLFAAFAALTPEERDAYLARVVAIFRGIHGGDTTTAYRYKDTGDKIARGGASLTTSEPTYLGAGNYSVYRVRADDVLVHWGQQDMPLSNKAFGHEREIILKPNAVPERIS